MSPAYAEQVEDDTARLLAATGLTHDQHIAALRLLVTAQLMEAEFMLADHQLPIPQRDKRAPNDHSR